MNDAELKPCPFCGCAPDLIEEMVGGVKWIISCPDCPARMVFRSSKTPEACIERWNDRRFGERATVAAQIAERMGQPNLGTPRPAPAEETPAVKPLVSGAVKVGNLPTMNADPYPTLGTWWVQLWLEGKVYARAYGDTPEEAHSRATAIALAHREKSNG